MEKTKDVYMISLDALDLNSLQISPRYRSGGAVPLWSTSHLDSRRNDYYEFVIKTDDNKEGLNEPVVKNVTCHICDMNVPEVYFNEHKNGFRHKFNRKVADTALKRLQLYADKEYNNENNEQLPSKHFCVECSIVINSEDETSHKQTTAHRSTVLLERFLNDFLNFYTNDDSEAVDIKIKDIKTEPVKNSKNSEQVLVLDEPNAEEKLTTDSILKSDEVNYKKPVNLDKLNNNCRSSSDLPDNYIFKEVCDGPNINKFKFTVTSYDAVVDTTARSKHCMICRETFAREKHSKHVNSNLHDQNLRLKPLDKNCIRKINTSHHNCVLCNEYFKDHELHINSETHLTNFRKNLISKRMKKAIDDNICNEDKKYDISKKYSDVIRNGNKSSADTNKNTAPVNKETADSFTASSSASGAIDGTDEDSNKILNTDSKEYICYVCQVELPNKEKNIIEHNAGRLHKSKNRNKQK